MKPIESSALIGLGALGILFGRKMPGVQVIADSQRAARYTAHPATCNGQPCPFSYIGNGRHHQSYNDKGNDEPQEFTEYAIERNKHAHTPCGQHMPAGHSQQNSQNDARQ